MNHLTSAFFHRKPENFVILRNQAIDFLIDFLIVLTFLESLKIFLTSMVINLMISAKMATLDVVKTMVF